MRHARCGAGMTIGSGTSKSKKKYYYYKRNERTNIGQRCKCPNVRREKLDDAVFRAVEKRILGPGRLEKLLKKVTNFPTRSVRSWSGN